MTGELKELLGEDGSRVYKEVEKALQGGNARTKSAASVGAAILAAHAATWAERVSRATGKPFTAQDYMKSVMIEADGTVREGALNALRAGIDLDERVKVVDISAAMPKKSMDAKAVKRFLQGLIRDNPLAITADGTAVVSILSNKDVEHITYSSRKNLPADIYRIRRKSILSIEELLENAVLIESIPNRKIKEKPYARAYHRFYVPVRMNQHLATIRIVAEERQGVITLNPTDVNLYDLIVEDKKRRATAPAGCQGCRRRTLLSASVAWCGEKICRILPRLRRHGRWRFRSCTRIVFRKRAFLCRKLSRRRRGASRSGDSR